MSGSTITLGIAQQDIASIKSARKELQGLLDTGKILEKDFKAMDAGLKGLMSTMASTSVKSPFSSMAKDTAKAYEAMKLYRAEVEKASATTGAGLNNKVFRDTVTTTKSLVTLTSQVNSELEKQATIKARLAVLGQGTSLQKDVAANLALAQKETAVLSRKVALAEAANGTYRGMADAQAKYAAETMVGVAAANKLIGVQSTQIGFSQRLQAQMVAQGATQRKVAKEAIATFNLEKGMAKQAADAVVAAELMKSKARMEGLAVQKRTANAAIATFNLEKGLSAQRAAAIAAGNTMREHAANTDNAVKSTERFTRSQAVLHDAIRGASGAFGKLWLGYGSLATIGVVGGVYALTAGIKGLATQTITAGADFEYTTKYISLLGTEADRSEVSLGKLRSGILDIANVAFDPGQLAKGMQELVKAGESTEDALAGVADVSRLATIGQVDMATAAELTVTAMNAFSKDGKNLSQVANIIATTANETAASVQEIGTAFSYTTELSTIAGMSLEQTAAAIGTLSNIGIKGSKAGTGLRTAIVNLIQPSEKLTAMMDKMGVSFNVFEEGGDKMKEFPALMKEIGDSVSHLNLRDKTAILTEMFDLRSLKVGVKFIEDFTKAAEDGGAKYEELLNKITNSTGGLERQLAELATTVQMKAELLGVAWRKALIEGYSGSNEGLMKVLTELTAIVNSPEFKDSLGQVATGIGNIALVLADVIANNPAAITSVFSALANGIELTAKAIDYAAKGAKLADDWVNPLTKVKIANENRKRFSEDGFGADFIFTNDALKESDAAAAKIAAANKGRELEEQRSIDEAKRQINERAAIAQARHTAESLKTPVSSESLSQASTNKQVADAFKQTQKEAQAADAALKNLNKTYSDQKSLIEKQRAAGEAGLAGGISPEAAQKQLDSLEHQKNSLELTKEVTALKQLQAKFDSAEKVHLPTDELEKQISAQESVVATLKAQLPIKQQIIDLDSKLFSANSAKKAAADAKRQAAEAEKYADTLKGVSNQVEDFISKTPTKALTDQEEAIIKVDEQYEKLVRSVKQAGLSEKDEAKILAQLTGSIDDVKKARIDDIDAMQAQKKYIKDVVYSAKEEEAALVAVGKKMHGMPALLNEINIERAKFMQTSEYTDALKLPAQGAEKAAAALDKHTKAAAKNLLTTENLIKAYREGDSAIDGFAAGIKNLEKNYTKLGEVGFQAFESIRGGVSDSIGTATKYLVHGLDDAKDALKDTMADASASISKTNQEAIADLDKQYLSSTMSAEEYSQNRVDIQKNFNESMFEAQEEYNKGILEAEGKLGDDFKAIWTGVLDSVIDNMSKWAGDLALKEFVIPIAGELFGDGFGEELKQLIGKGPTGFSGDPIHAWVDNMSSSMGGGEFPSTGMGSGTYSDMLGTASTLSGAFAAGSGWDTVGTQMGDNMATAVNTNIDFTGAAVDAFGTTSSAWDRTGSEIMSGANDSWGRGTLDSVQGRDMLSSATLETKPTQQTLMQQAKPYLMAAGAAMSAYSAYNQYQQGNYVGAGVSGIGAASNAYQAYSGMTGTAMGAGGTAAVAGAGVIGGAYGVYSGIKDIAENGLTLSNGAMTALSAYSTYASASALYASMGGTAFAGAGGMTAITTAIGDGLATVGTSIGSAISGMGGGAATGVGTGVGVGGGAGVGAGGGAGGAGASASSGSAGMGALGGAAAVAAVAYAFIDGFLVNHDRGIVDSTMQTSNGTPWTYGSNAADKNFANKYEDVAIGSARMSSDIIANGGSTVSAIENFRSGIDVLTNQFNSGSAEIYRALESGAVTFEQYAESISGVDITTQQAARMQTLATQSANGSTAAMQNLQGELMSVGVESFAAADAAVAMSSAAAAQASGYRTSTSGLEGLNIVTDLYIDRIAQQDVALGTSMVMYDNARSAMAGSDDALSKLTNQFREVGLTSNAADKAARQMVSDIGNGAEVMGAVAAGFREMIPAVAGVNFQMSDLKFSEEELAMATGALSGSTLGAAMSLDNLTPSMQGVAAGVGGLQAGLDGLTGTAFNTANTISTINNPLDSLTDNLDQFGNVTWGVNEKLKLAMQGTLSAGLSAGGIVGYAGGGVIHGGSGVRDDVYGGKVGGRDILLQGGEHIMPVEQTQKYMTQLELMRADKYAVGGTVDESYRVPSAAERAALASQGSATQVYHSGATPTSYTPPYRPPVAANYGSATTQVSNLADLLKEVADSWSSYLTPAEQAGKTMAELSATMQDNINKLTAAGRLGDAFDQRGEFEKAKQAEQNKILDPARDIITKDWMTDYAYSMKEVNDYYKEQKAILKSLGGSITELNAIEKARGIVLADLAEEHAKALTDAMSEVNDIISKDTLTELQYNTKKVNDHFNEMRAGLITLGASTADLAKLEQARNIQLKEQTGTTAADYYKDLISMGATVSTFGSASAFGNMHTENKVEVTVVVDGNGIINKGKLNNLITEIADASSYNKGRRSYSGLTTYPGV